MKPYSSMGNGCGDTQDVSRDDPVAQTAQVAVSGFIAAKYQESCRLRHKTPEFALQMLWSA